MKRFLTFLSFVLFMACSESELLKKEQNPNEFAGLSKAQLQAVSVSSVTILSTHDDSYSTASMELRNQVLNNPAAKVQSSDLGDYLIITDNRNHQISLLSVAQEGKDEKYVIEVREGEYYFLTQINKADDVEGTPNFEFVVTALNGDIVFNGKTGRVAKTWWGCVEQEFYKMCLETELKAVMCGAAGGACPECGLIVYGAWMLSCAWD